MSKKITFLLSISIGISLIVGLATFFLAKQVLGVVTFGGEINMGSNDITNVGTPETALEAATKGYVDSAEPTAKSAVRAYRSGNQPGLGLGPTKIQFNAENYDEGLDFSISSYRFTAPTAGYYFIYAQIYWNGTSVPPNRELHIYKSDVSIAMNRHVVSGPNDRTKSIASIEYLTAGQYIEIFAGVSNIGTLTGGSDKTFLVIYKLGG